MRALYVCDWVVVFGINIKESKSISTSKSLLNQLISSRKKKKKKVLLDFLTNFGMCGGFTSFILPIFQAVTWK